MHFSKKRELRRAQSITPFGPGAILDIDGESFVATDISRVGKKDYEVIEEPRLAHALGKSHFRSPRNTNSEDEIIPFERFPSWLFCPKCRRLKIYYHRETPYCDSCKGVKLIPMRFVMACPRGHLSDIPWTLWAHSTSRGTRCELPDLRFLTLPGGSGLDRLIVKCETCGAQRSLQGIADRDSLRRLNVSCAGKQPWQRGKVFDPCDAIPQCLQRGATNLTFLFVESAISLPSGQRIDKDAELVRSHAEYAHARNNTDNETILNVYLSVMSRSLKLKIERVKEIVLSDLQNQSSPVAVSADDNTDRRSKLLTDEYAVLATSDPIRTRHLSKTSIEARDLLVHQDSTYITRKLTRIVRVTRLREVRAVVGFSRLSPVSDRETESDPPVSYSTYNPDSPRIHPILVPADLRGDSVPFNERWLPAIEVFGEGIFIQFNEAEIRKWESRKEVIRHLSALFERASVGPGYLPAATPRFVLLHTFAHLLTRQLSFECGYSIASLRERLYCSSPESREAMAGVLIYTSAGDSEGTLGGLVRQADPERLLPVIEDALNDAQWCSSDPLCRDSRGQGPDALNLAACHSCTLLPETSCIYSNRLLDRTTLIGSLDGSIPGFLSI